MSFFGDFVGVRFFSWPQESAYKEKHTTHVTRTADTRGQGKSCLRGQTLPSPIVFATKAADKLLRLWEPRTPADTRGPVRFQHGLSMPEMNGTGTSTKNNPETCTTYKKYKKHTCEKKLSSF